MTERHPRPTADHSILNILRWLCLFPAAWLGGQVSTLLFGAFAALLRFMLTLGGSIETGFANPPSATSPLILLAIYFPFGFGFVLTTGLMAPHFSRLTAVIAMSAYSALALRNHILGQAEPTLTGAMHFGTELLAAALGVLLVFIAQTWLTRLKQRQAPDVSSAD